MAKTRREIAMLIIAFLGMLLALYAIPLHYSSGGSLCDINNVLSCDKVNKSEWSTLFGIPVAILGLLSYAIVFFAVLKRGAIERALSFTRQDFAQYLLLFAFVMFGFQVYLTATELFFINALCIVCVGSQVLTFLLAAIATIEYFRPKEA